VLRKILQGILTYIHDLRLLTPNARKYLLGVLFISMSFSAFLLLLNLYLRERSFGEALIGRVLSVGAIGMTIVSIPGALLLSRIRLKPVLLVSTFLTAVFGVITAYSEPTWLIMMAYFITGAMMTFYRIASAPFFMRNSGTRERQYLFSLSFGITVGAGVLGSWVFGWLVEYFTESGGMNAIEAHRLALTIGVVLSLLALIPFGLLKTPAQIPSEDRLVFSRQILKPLRGIMTRLTLPYFIVGAGAGMIIPFLNIFFRDRFEQSTNQIGLYIGMVNATMFIGIMTAPVLVKHIGKVRTIVYTQLASIPFMFILAYSFNFPLVVFAFLVRGALMNMGMPVGTNFAMETVPASHHGLVNALLMFAWTSSWMVSTQIGGWVIEHYGYTLSLNIAIVLYIISSLLYFLFFRRSENRTDAGFEVVNKQILPK